MSRVNQISFSRALKASLCQNEVETRTYYKKRYLPVYMQYGQTRLLKLDC